MNYLSHFQLMAHYNCRMNKQLYVAANRLPEHELRTDKGAFFKSILGTLNHILVGDLVWLLRFIEHSHRYQSLIGLRNLRQPQRLDEILYDNLDSLEAVRFKVDKIIEYWLHNEVQECDLHQPLSYKNTLGAHYKKDFAKLISHMFNHQTHHRGQVSTLFNQLGVDIGETDYLIDIPNADNAKSV